MRIIQLSNVVRKDQRLGEILRIQAIGIRNGQDLNEIKI